MSNRKILEANREGQDYVIGDLHGSYSVFENLLKNLNFDKTKDRIISVGDLVDRGPDSYKCLQLLNEPWFHCVRANHEAMMVSAFFGGTIGHYWKNNGGEWGYDLYASLKLENKQSFLESEFGQLIYKAAKLPYMISVERKDGSQVHVIHAELPPEAVVIDTFLDDPAFVDDIISMENHEGSYFLWGRFMFLEFYRFNLENIKKVARKVQNKLNYYKLPLSQIDLSHIVSGHTIVQRPLTIGGQTCIDTAAFDSYSQHDEYGQPTGCGRIVNGKRQKLAKWCALTAVEVNDWKFFQATETKFRETMPLVVDEKLIKKFSCISQ